MLIKAFIKIKLSHQ